MVEIVQWPLIVLGLIPHDMEDYIAARPHKFPDYQSISSYCRIQTVYRRMRQLAEHTRRTAGRMYSFVDASAGHVDDRGTEAVGPTPAEPTSTNDPVLKELLKQVQQLGARVKRTNRGPRNTPIAKVEGRRKVSSGLAGASTVRANMLDSNALDSKISIGSTAQAKRNSSGGCHPGTKERSRRRKTSGKGRNQSPRASPTSVWRTPRTNMTMMSRLASWVALLLSLEVRHLVWHPLTLKFQRPIHLMHLAVMLWSC